MNSSTSTTLLATARGSFRVALDGDASAPALLLSNSLGTTLEMWEPQVQAFSRNYRLIRYDTRGHGGSPATPGPYGLDGLGQDVLALLDALNIGKAAFCGISMGGHIGLWLGIHAASRFSAIAVCNSAAKIGSTQAWKDRAAIVRQGGATAMRALADSAPGRWFSDGFIRSQPELVLRAQGWLSSIEPEGYAACCEALAASDLRSKSWFTGGTAQADPAVVADLQKLIGGIAPEGYAACCEALADADLRSSVAGIALPTLLLAGAYDPVTTVADSQALQAAISKAQLAVLPASHLSNLEAPQAFEEAVLWFFDRFARAT